MILLSSLGLHRIHGLMKALQIRSFIFIIFIKKIEIVKPIKIIKGQRKELGLHKV